MRRGNGRAVSVSAAGQRNLLPALQAALGDEHWDEPRDECIDG